MRAAIAKEWADSLRSGEYKQGKHVLRSEGSFCCLGVLCDIYRTKASGGWNGIRFVAFDGTSSEIELPLAVRTWAGMQSSNPVNPKLFLEESRGQGLPATLSDMNDEGATFEEIADLIDSCHETF